MELPFIPLQFLIQNFIEQLFGRWMSERPEEMEGRTAAQKGVVVPSQLNGREPGKLRKINKNLLVQLFDIMIKIFGDEILCDRRYFPFNLLLTKTT